MTLIMVRCARCAEPIDLVSSGVHRVKRENRPVRVDRYAHTDTKRERCGAIGALLGRRATPDLDRLVADTTAALDKSYTLAWVDQDDDLTPQQIQVLLDGVNESESSEFANLEEFEWDMRRGSAVTAVGELLDDELFELLDNAGRLDEILWEVEERDDSEGLATLRLNNTRGHLFRFDLGVDVPPYADQDSEVTRQVAEAAGLDLDHPSSAASIARLLDQAHSGGRLSVLWYTSPVDAMALAAPYVADDVHGSVAFTDAHLLILDSWSGSGGEVRVPWITAEWSPRRVSIDAAKMRGGYTWTDVCVPSTSAYGATYELTRTTTTTPTAAAAGEEA